MFNYLIAVESFSVAFLCFQEADLAITDLTITAERESAVDFTMPFMNLGEWYFYKPGPDWFLNLFQE